MRDQMVSVLTRALATAILLLIGGALWLVSLKGAKIPEDWTAWCCNVGSGLVVLGIAGIWISYFVERQTVKGLTRDIESRFSILSAVLSTNINDVYHSDALPDGSRGCPRLRQRIVYELERTRDEVRILGVAARGFLQQGQGYAFDALERLLKAQSRPAGSTPPTDGSAVDLNRPHVATILLLHPLSENAVSRALREDPRHQTFDVYRETTLFKEVMESGETLVDWSEKKGYDAEARLYKVFPACFLILVNDVAFVEQYHFGTGGRASGKVPIFEVAKGSEFYRQLEGHFEHVWEKASGSRLSKELLADLTEPKDIDEQEFRACLEFSRPDLF